MIKKKLPRLSYFKKPLIFLKLPLIKRIIFFILFFIFLNVFLLNKDALAADCSIQINGSVQEINRTDLRSINLNQGYTIKITGLYDDQSEILEDGEYLSLTVFDSGLQEEIYSTERGEINQNSDVAEINNFKIEEGIGLLTFQLFKKQLPTNEKIEVWCSLGGVEITNPTQEALDTQTPLVDDTEKPNTNNNFSWPTFSFGPSVTLEEFCQKKADERNSRPTACYLCTESNLTPSCASSFKVFDEVEYLKTGGDPIEKDWGGDITVDPKGIKIPFVGLEENENESDYLADYLEGTNEYYANHNNQTTLSNYQGVLRKLTPFDYQNQIKKTMVEKAKNKEIHDYPIRYVGRLCWDTPLWLSAATAIAEKLGLPMPDINHFCLYEDFMNHTGDWVLIKGYRLFTFFGGEDFRNFLEGLAKTPGLIHYAYIPGVDKKPISIFADSEEFKPPPNPSDFSKSEEYQKAFLEWKYKDQEKEKLTDAAKLWSTLPMLNREDSYGEIDPYLSPQNEKDTFLPEEPGIEAVPHVARLYEGSQIIHQTLTPKGKELEMFVSESTKTIPPNACFMEKYIPPTGTGDELCCDPVKKTLEAWEKFDNPPCTDDLSTEANECEEKADVSREFGVALEHPYLDEIWSYTTYANSAGFFNIFRPYQKEQFEDIAAADRIGYKYNGEISPEEGLFFFPHLGGVQAAKESTVNKTLWPCYDNSPWPCKQN